MIEFDYTFTHTGLKDKESHGYTYENFVHIYYMKYTLEHPHSLVSKQFTRKLAPYALTLFPLGYFPTYSP